MKKHWLTISIVVDSVLQVKLYNLIQHSRPEEVFHFEVFDAAEDLKGIVPEELYVAVLQAINNPCGVEVLDI